MRINSCPVVIAGSLEKELSKDYKLFSPQSLLKDLIEKTEISHSYFNDKAKKLDILIGSDHHQNLLSYAFSKVDINFIKKFEEFFEKNANHALIQSLLLDCVSGVVESSPTKTKFLLECGVDPNFRIEAKHSSCGGTFIIGLTPIMVAKKNVIPLLLDYGARLDMKAEVVSSIDALLEMSINHQAILNNISAGILNPFCIFNLIKSSNGLFFPDGHLRFGKQNYSSATDRIYQMLRELFCHPEFIPQNSTIYDDYIVLYQKYKLYFLDEMKKLEGLNAYEILSRFERKNEISYIFKFLKKEHHFEVENRMVIHCEDVHSNFQMQFFRPSITQQIVKENNNQNLKNNLFDNEFILDTSLVRRKKPKIIQPSSNNTKELLQENLSNPSKQLSIKKTNLLEQDQIILNSALSFLNAYIIASQIAFKSFEEMMAHKLDLLHIVGGPIVLDKNEKELISGCIAFQYNWLSLAGGTKTFFNNLDQKHVFRFLSECIENNSPECFQEIFKMVLVDDNQKSSLFVKSINNKDQHWALFMLEIKCHPKMEESNFADLALEHDKPKLAYVFYQLGSPIKRKEGAAYRKMCEYASQQEKTEIKKIVCHLKSADTKTL